MAQETTSAQELQYLIREIAREMNDNLPGDLTFLVVVCHKGDGQVGWSTRQTSDGMNMAKIRAVMRDWLDRADKMVVADA
jgi:hypothetical protein